MNPLPDPAADSPLATLRQLKELLDAGTITPQEFETLKQRLLVGPAAGPAAAPATPGPAPAGPAAGPAAAAPATPGPAPAAPTEAPPTPYLDTPAALTPEATPLLAPEPDWLAAAAPPLLTPLGPADADEEPAEVAERRNPLNLVFAIGGLLLFLGVLAYLTLGRPTAPDEHLTSTSQTAADTTALAPEVGPQAQQLTLPPAAAPETIRTAPAVVPLTAPPAATPPPDSAAPASTPPPAASAPPAPKAAAPKPAAPAAPTPATDTATSKP